jgi:hypothetical protein
MSNHRIYIDFSAGLGNDLYSLDCAGTSDDMKYYGLTLEDGRALSVWSYDADPQGNPDNLIAEGSVEYSAEHQRWVIKIDAASIRHESDEVSRAPR